jgi:23S rRNA (adenine2503-C2)-methyltransferase
VVPGIYRFADEGWQVGLAISLHAPNDQLRSRLMPINRRYPLLDLLTACRYYCSKTKRRITFEYTLIQGENDKNEHAFQLADLIQGMNTYVNLIPLNSVAEKKYVCSSPDRFEKFLEILTSRRIRCTVRHRRGYEIDAACGQLRNKARM